MPEIVVVAAVAEGNRVIGNGMELPWHIPADLRHFKRLTTGHPLVMGRRTFESVSHQFGGPLPNRQNVVLTRDADAARRLEDMADNVKTFSSLEEAVEAYGAREIIFIGGGATVYEAVLDDSDGAPAADRLELTIVEGSFEGDTFFPPFEHLLSSVYTRLQSEAHPAEGNTPGFRFESWIRKTRENRSAAQ